MPKVELLLPPVGLLTGDFCWPRFAVYVESRKTQPGRVIAICGRELPMNRMQRLALLVGVIVVVGMGVYSPWRHIKRGARGIYTTESAGYSLIVRPPPCKTGAAYSVELDVSRLAVQEGIGDSHNDDRASVQGSASR
jgi:hypothetical protein